MTVKQRNALLAEMTDAVAERVLRGSYTQTQALSLARVQAPAMLEVHERVMRDLEAAGRLDRAIEALPDAEMIAERRTAGLGLTQPELAVMLAYSKIVAVRRAAGLRPARGPGAGRRAGPLLPVAAARALRRRRAPAPAEARDRRHARDQRPDRPRGLDVRLPPARRHRRVDGRHRARLGGRARRLQRALAVGGRRGARRRRRRPTTQYDMLLSSRRMVERSTRWLLRSRPRPLDIAAERERYGEGAKTRRGAAPGRARRARAGELARARRPAHRGGRAGGLGRPRGGAGRALLRAGHRRHRAAPPSTPVEEVAALHFEIGGNLHLHWLRDRIALLARDTRWAAMARAALRDDLFSLHAELTTDVLRAGGVDAWIVGKEAAVERAQEILAEIRSGGTFDLTTLPVALREVRNLIGRG